MSKCLIITPFVGLLYSFDPDQSQQNIRYDLDSMMVNFCNI